MKITAREEYGLRILLRIARNGNEEGLTISEIATMEGLSMQNVAKLCRVLRLLGYIESNRGAMGGYRLSKPAVMITISEILNGLGGRLYSETFCDNHKGLEKLCTNSVDCSIKSLWKILQHSLDKVLCQITLYDLITSDVALTYKMNEIN